MKYCNSHLYLLVLSMVLFFALLAKNILSQCPNPVLHTSGSEMVGGCTEVTVTSVGDVSIANPAPCFYGPYWVGRLAPGSYIFNFSPAIAGISINVQTLDNHFGNIEEMRLEINGAFYPIVNPGVVDGCFMPAIIWPPGVIRGAIDDNGSWQDIVITEQMTLLKIENNWVSGTPAGFFVSLYICCSTCETIAGQINSAPLELCPSDLATFPPAEQMVLDADDILQYILFSDANNILGSIITTSLTPSFAFDQNTMSYDVTYYVAAIAGNDLGGMADLTDPCLSISNFIEVTWHPFPTVAFFSSDVDICPGNCYDIEVNFTGLPPFQLSGEIVSGINIIATFGQTYASHSGILPICLPPNTPLGAIEINATELIDANCTCD